MVESYPFTVWSGLLTPEHTEAMDDALRVYLWCLDAITRQEDGIGWCLYRRPIGVRHIAKRLGLSKSTVQRHLDMMDGKYIVQDVGPEGRIIGVLRSKKLWLRPKNSTRLPPGMKRCPVCGQRVDNR